MIRLIALLSTIAALAGPAAAADIHVSLAGKDAQTIHTEIVAAANTVCASELTSQIKVIVPMIYEMNACVEETVQATYAKMSPRGFGALASASTTRRQ